MPNSGLKANAHRSAEQWLRLIEQRGDVGTWGWRIGSDEVTWSPGMYRLLGFDPATVTPSYGLYRDLLHPEDRRESGDPFALAASGALNEGVARIIRPDGSLRWVKNIGQVVHARDGTAAAMVGVTFDITDQERALAETRRLVSWNRLAFNQLTAEPWARASGGRALRRPTVPGTQEGQTPVIDTWAEDVHPDDRGSVLAAWQTAVQSEAGFEATYRVRDAAGVTRTVVSHGVPVRDALGRVEAWVGITADANNGLPPNGQQALGADDPVSPAQIRAARAFIGWSGQELASHAGVSFSTVRRAETESDRVIRLEVLLSIRRALEGAGVAFGRDAKGRSTVSG